MWVGDRHGEEGEEGEEGQKGHQEIGQEGTPSWEVDRLDAASAKNQEMTMTDDKKRGHDKPDRPLPPRPQERPHPQERPPRTTHDHVRKDSDGGRTTDWNRPPRKDKD
jgi:hypothetical protein